MPKNKILKLLLMGLEWILGYFAIFLTFCLIFLHSLGSIQDSDIWLHIRAGEFIFKNCFMPVNDIFSFTLANKPWLNHEWIFQLCSYLSFSRFGIDGLVYLKVLGLISSFLVLFFIARRFTGVYLESALLIFLAASAGYSRFNIRPEIFSLLLFCIYLYLLEFCPRRKIIWIILPLQVIWANSHGYFFLGPVLIFLYLVADFLNQKVRFLSLKWQGREVYDHLTFQRLKFIFLFSILLTFVNPHGIRGAIYPLQVFLGILCGQAKESFVYILELRPVFVLNVASLKFYYFMMVLYFVILLLSIQRLRVRDILLGIFFVFFGMVARNVLFFIAISVVGISFYFGFFFKSFKNQLAQEHTSLLIRRMLVLRYLLALCMLLFIAGGIKRQCNEVIFDFKTQKLVHPFFGLDEEYYPEEAVNFILANNLPERMYNDFNSGSYLIGKGYPLRKVFIDGRSEFYGHNFLNQYFKAQNGDVASIEAIIEKYDLQAVLLTMVVSPAQKIAGYFYKNSAWKLVFIDDLGVIFLKDVKANQHLIKKYQIDLNKYKVQPVDIKKIGLNRVYPGPYVRRAFLFDVFELYDLEIQEAKEALRIFPSCWKAHWYLGRAYLQQKRYQQAWESLRWACILSNNNSKVLADWEEVKKHLK